MGYDFEKTHKLILESAKNHFAQNGFEGASIRQICKDAGVTNGAFYSHFKSKEELFSKLVDPVISGLYKLYDDESSCYEKKDLQSVQELVTGSDQTFIRYIYDNADIFRLILCSGKGTEYEEFTKKFSSFEAENTGAFLGKKGKTKKLSEAFIRRLSSFVIDIVFDSFLEGKTEKETLKQAQLASEFCLAGLKQVLENN